MEKLLKLPIFAGFLNTLPTKTIRNLCHDEAATELGAPLLFLLVQRA